MSKGGKRVGNKRVKHGTHLSTSEDFEVLKIIRNEKTSKRRLARREKVNKQAGQLVQEMVINGEHVRAIPAKEFLLELVRLRAIEKRLIVEYRKNLSDTDCDPDVLDAIAYILGYSPVLPDEEILESKNERDV